MSRVFTPTFTGGNQIATSKFLVSPDELALAMNVDNLIIGTWATRAGTTRIGGVLGAIRGLFGDQNSGGKHLAVVDGTAASLKYNNAGTWTDISGATTLPAGVNVNFLSFIDNTYVFGVTATGSFMTTGKLASTTYTDPTLPKAAFGNVFYDQVYLADCELSNVRYRNRVYYSTVPTYSSGWSFTFNTGTDYLQFSTNDGDYITGIAASYGNNLVFKNFSLHGFDVNQNQFPLDGIGCTSPRSIVSLDDKSVFYAHISHKDKGIFRWDGTGAKKISRGIEPWIKGCSGNVVGGSEAGHILMFIGDVALDPRYSEYYGLEEAYSNVMLDYSVSDDTWIIHTLPYAVTIMAPNDNDLYFGSNGVHQWAEGTTDSGTEISSTIITHNHYGASSLEYNLRKTFTDHIINMHSSSGAKAWRSIDNSEWVEVATLAEKVNNYSAASKGFGIRTKITGNFIFEGVEYGANLEKPVKTT